MIESTLLKFRKTSELKVLCFPGIDTAEVKQVYDLLGIPRYNITGVERESHVADQIEQNCPGINIVRGTLEEYVANLQRHDYDIISLDYIGACRLQQLDCLGT